MRPLVIIGNGIAGTTVARQVRKRADRPVMVISAEAPYFFSRTALMYYYMGQLTREALKPYEDHFWPKNRIELRQAQVTSLRPENRQLLLHDGTVIHYDQLVIATGSVPRPHPVLSFGIKGVQGFYHWQDVEQLIRLTPRIRQAVVVGGGLIGIELAEMLRAKDIGVTMIVKDAHYWGSILPPEEAALVHDQLRRHGVAVRYQTQVVRVETDANGHLSAVCTDSGETIGCQWAGVAIGVEPAIDFLRGSGISLRRGVLVNAFLETNLQDIYAAGDCAQFEPALPGRAQVEQVWYTGRMQGEVLARTLTGERTAYRPGPWFNSAKFFQLEYQVYGQVPAQDTADIESFVWQDPRQARLLRIAFRRDNGQVTGMHAMGIRYRHVVCEDWLKKGLHLSEVVAALPQANFDGEFGRRPEGDIQAAFRSRFPGLPLSESLPIKRWFEFWK